MEGKVQLPPRGSTFRRQMWRERFAAYGFLTPLLILMAVFVVYGVFFVIYVSFHRWDGVALASLEWRGLRNYELLFSDPLFLKSIINMAIFMVSTVTIQLFGGLFLALLLRPHLKGHGFFKAIFYIPVALSTTIIARTFMGLYEPSFGLLNSFFTGPIGEALRLQGFAQVWLGNPDTALAAIIVANIFQWTGAQMVFYIAGLTSIAEETFEAAQLDGANFWQTFRHVVWPSLWPTHTTVIVLGMVGAVKTFDIVWLLTQGGPGNATQFPATLLYKAVAENFQAGYGAAISLVMIVLCVGLSALQFSLARERKA